MSLMRYQRIMCMYIYNICTIFWARVIYPRVRTDMLWTQTHTHKYVYIYIRLFIYLCVNLYFLYLFIYIFINFCPFTIIYIYTARTGVLPGKLRFDCAGLLFCEILHIVRLPKRMTNIFPVVLLFFTHHHHHHHHHGGTGPQRSLKRNPQRNPKEILNETLMLFLYTHINIYL